MQLPGTTPINPVNPLHNQDLTLRLNQRLVAEVVEVAGTQVVLSVNGTPIVARLEGQDAQAQLAGRRVAQFVVTSLADGEAVLRLQEASQPAAPPAAPKPGEVAVQILDDMGIEQTPANLLLARAAISQHLTVTAEVLEELQLFLDGMQPWGQGEAILAAAMKATGLPLTEGAFRMASQSVPSFGLAVADLAAALNHALAGKHLLPELEQVLREGLSVLEHSMLAWGRGAQGYTGPGAGEIRSAVEVFGRSLENALLTLAKNGSLPEGEGGLLRLANLCQIAKDSGEPALAEKIGAFLNGLERGQLSNLRPDPVPGQGDWCAAQFFLKSGSPAQPKLSPARVRVARGGTQTGSIDGASTRLVIGVDIGPQETIQVDLTLVGQRARAIVITPSADLQRRSQEEMPSFIESLRGMGIQIVDSRFAVGQPAADGLLTVNPLSELANRRVNIKV